MNEINRGSIMNKLNFDNEIKNDFNIETGELE